MVPVLIGLKLIEYDKILKNNMGIWLHVIPVFFKRMHYLFQINIIFAN